MFSALFAIFADVNVMYIPQDSPLVLHLLTSWRPACSRSLPHMHVQRRDLAGIRMCNRTDRRRTRYHCASDPAIVVCVDKHSYSETNPHREVDARLDLMYLFNISPNPYILSTSHIYPTGVIRCIMMFQPHTQVQVTNSRIKKYDALCYS